MSHLNRLRDLIGSLSTNAAIQSEILTILEDVEKRLYSLEADRKRLLADYAAHDSKIQSLEKRYSELLYRFKEKG